MEEQIRLTLENLEADFDPTTWERLSNRMDFEAQEAVDDLFKGSLGKIEAPMMSGGSWEAMEKLIEADEAAEMIENETELDHVAYSKLNNLRVPFSEHHWALMAKRLEEEFSLRHILYRYKVAEMALMALLLLSIIRFAPMVEDWMETSSATQTNSTHTLKPAPTIYETGIRPIAANPNSKTDPQHNEDATKLSKKTIAGTGNVVIPSVLNEEKELKDGNQMFANTTNYYWRGQYLSILPQKEIKTIEASSEKSTPIEAFDTKQNKLLAISKKRTALHPPVVLPPIANVNADYSWELPRVESTPIKKQNQLRFSIFTTTDFNYVTSPPNEVRVFGEPVKTESNATVASGYGGGVTVSWKRNRWEYQTGGIYSFKRYIPNTPIFIFDTPNFFIKEDFNGIQLDIFQLPVNVLFHFKNQGKWRFYASAGASSYFVTSTIYEIDHEKQALHLIPPTQGSPDDNKSITNSGGYRFPPGLLDGGNLQDNFYMTANLGLGVERYLSPKWTVFFQPNYQHFFMSDGIGDNMDKIYTTSFYLGTKFNLK